MNQSILFNDQQTWAEDKRAVIFVAQQSGHLIECIVFVSYLEVLAQQPINDKEAAYKAFAEYRFDLEELAEELIDGEEFNQLGQIEIS
jgi:hypothetical protein